MESKGACASVHQMRATPGADYFSYLWLPAAFQSHGLAKEVIWIRDGRKCKNPTCGREVKFSEGHVHHIVEHTAGGKTKLDNGILVCPECHASRSNMQALTPVFQNHIKQVLAQNQFPSISEFA